MAVIDRINYCSTENLFQYLYKDLTIVSKNDICIKNNVQDILGSTGVRHEQDEYITVFGLFIAILTVILTKPGTVLCSFFFLFKSVLKR